MYCILYKVRIRIHQNILKYTDPENIWPAPRTIPDNSWFFLSLNICFTHSANSALEAFERIKFSAPMNLTPLSDFCLSKCLLYPPILQFRLALGVAWKSYLKLTLPWRRRTGSSSPPLSAPRTMPTQRRNCPDRSRRLILRHVLRYCTYLNYNKLNNDLFFAQLLFKLSRKTGVKLAKILTTVRVSFCYSTLFITKKAQATFWSSLHLR